MTTRRHFVGELVADDRGQDVEVEAAHRDVGDGELAASRAAWKSQPKPVAIPTSCSAVSWKVM